MKRCGDDKIKIKLSVALFAIKQLSKARELPNFGNAGTVNNLLSEAKKTMSKRLSGLPKHERKDELIESDFGIVEHDETPEMLFAGLVGCDNIVSKLHEYHSLVTMCKAKGQDPKKFIEFNFLFMGAPGTGKTTIARRMGQMFHSLELLPSAEVIEKSASDLITGYVGQAGKVTYDVMAKARGKVLFVDEAYRLNPKKGGPYMQEVLDELVQQLTSEEFKGRMVVILAGYEKDMDELLNVNEGLRSRFSEKLHFDNFTPEAVVTMMKSLIERGMASLSKQAEDHLPSFAQDFIKLPNFGNGRDVETLVKRIIREYAMSKDHQHDITIDHITKAFNQIRKVRESKDNGDVVMTDKTSSIQPQEQMMAHTNPPPLPQAVTAMTIAKRISPPQQHRDESSGQVEEYLTALQTILDQPGLNSKEGVEQLSTCDVNSEEFQNLAGRLSTALKIPFQHAVDKLMEWRSAQKNVRSQVEEQEEEMELAKKMKRKALRAIWRCGVCGRADQPYIVCYVQPYIVRYDEVDVDG